MDPISNVSESFFNQVSNTGKDTVKESSFQDTLKSLVSQVEEQLDEAAEKTESFAAGKGESLHETMIATETAGLSFRFLLQVRNKLLEAYQEIMRMSF